MRVPLRNAQLLQLFTGQDPRPLAIMGVELHHEVLVLVLGHAIQQLWPWALVQRVCHECGRVQGALLPTAASLRHHLCHVLVTARVVQVAAQPLELRLVEAPAAVHIEGQKLGEDVVIVLLGDIVLQPWGVRACRHRWSLQRGRGCWSFTWVGHRGFSCRGCLLLTRLPVHDFLPQSAIKEEALQRQRLATHGTLALTLEPGLNGFFFKVVALPVHHRRGHKLLCDGTYVPVWGLSHKGWGTKGCKCQGNTESATTNTM